MSASKLHGDQSGRTQTAESDSAKGMAQAGELLEGNFHAHGELARSHGRALEIAWYHQQVFFRKRVELRVESRTRLADVAPDHDAITHFQQACARTERDDFAHRLVAGLSGKVRIAQLHAGKHRLALEDMHVPVWTSRHAEHPDQHFAGSRLGHGRVFPDRSTWRLNLKLFHHLHLYLLFGYENLGGGGDGDFSSGVFRKSTSRTLP